ncbi:sigma-E factor negative regulatory protein [Lampropedia cohaerens]|uniref:sigma-E factor negative regulatory protein n=1 Tax=Lampropedia cohaerens TaxID=1610491 RepID=UPI000A07CD58|nr:sigma-E factor negative regulatory protein [Lampropedia cohaerens]
MPPLTRTAVCSAAQEAAAPSAAARDQLSALLDGELADAECEALLSQLEQEAATAQDSQQLTPLLADWECYNVIGQTLRAPLHDHVGTDAAAFLTRLRGRLAEQSQDHAPTVQSGALQPAPQLAAVAPPGANRNAANASLFRWKMVAGFASVAAIAAIGWNSLTSFNGDAQSAGTQMAANTPPASSVRQAPGSATPVQVAVQDASSGEVLIRDPELDAILSQQYANTQALQPPAPFLRNASMAGGAGRN